MLKTNSGCVIDNEWTTFQLDRLYSHHKNPFIHLFGACANITPYGSCVCLVMCTGAHMYSIKVTHNTVLLSSSLTPYRSKGERVHATFNEATCKRTEKQACVFRKTIFLESFSKHCRIRLGVSLIQPTVNGKRAICQIQRICNSRSSLNVEVAEVSNYDDIPNQSCCLYKIWI